VTLTVRQLRGQVMLALGGAPAVAAHLAGATETEAAAEADTLVANAINGAGRFLFSRGWGFRRLPTVTVTVAAEADHVELPDSIGEILSIRREGICDSGVQLIDADRLEEYRSDGSIASWGERYATLTRSNATDGAGLGARRLDLWPAFSVEEDLRIRSMRSWPTITAATDGEYVLPVADYVETLLTVLCRVFAQGLEEDQLSTRLVEVQAGPLWRTAITVDGATHPHGSNDIAGLVGEHPAGNRFAGSRLPNPTP